MAHAVIIAVHGLGGRGKWFTPLKRCLRNEGIELETFDLIGFGESEGSANMRGHIDSYYQWTNQVEAKIQNIKHKYPFAKIFLLGHSLGGVIISNLTQYDVKGVIFSVPGFKGAKETFKPNFVSKVAFNYFLDKFIRKTQTLIELPSSKTDDSPLTYADKDPHRTNRVTANLLMEINKMTMATKKRIKDIYQPILLIQAADDKVVDNDEQKKYYDLLQHCNRKRKIYPDVEHDWIWDANVGSQIGKDIIKFVETYS